MLSAPQIRVLAVLAILNFVQSSQERSFDSLMGVLDAQLRPFYYKPIPCLEIEYSHMDSCRVGTLFVGRSVYAGIISKYPQVFYDPFPESLVNRELHGIDATVCEQIIVGDETKCKFTDAAISEFITDAGGADDYASRNPVKDLYREVRWSEGKAVIKIRAHNSELADFLDMLNSSHAPQFHINAAGLVIGYQAWKQAAPEIALGIESLFPGSS